MTPSSLLLLQTAGESLPDSLLSTFVVVFVVFAIFTSGFILIRSVVLWYWRIDVAINNQEQQTALLAKQNHLLEHQIKLLTELKDQTGNGIAGDDSVLKKQRKSITHSQLVS